MTVSDLLDKRVEHSLGDNKVLRCGIIALDARTGNILFDTYKNREEYIEQFKTGEVIALWADVKLKRGFGFSGDYFAPVMKCYVSHDSWKDVWQP